MEVIMKIVKSLEESGLLIKDVSETIKSKTKKKKKREKKKENFLECY